jgi:hypothetical protein
MDVSKGEINDKQENRMRRNSKAMSVTGLDTVGRQYSAVSFQNGREKWT